MKERVVHAKQLKRADPLQVWNRVFDAEYEPQATIRRKTKKWTPPEPIAEEQEDRAASAENEEVQEKLEEKRLNKKEELSNYLIIIIR